MYDHDNVLRQVTGQITGVSDVTWQIIGVHDAQNNDESDITIQVTGRHDNILKQSCFNFADAYDKTYKQQ